MYHGPDENFYRVSVPSLHHGVSDLKGPYRLSRAPGCVIRADYCVNSCASNVRVSLELIAGKKASCLFKTGVVE